MLPLDSKQLPEFSNDEDDDDDEHSDESYNVPTLASI